MEDTTLNDIRKAYKTMNEGEAYKKPAGAQGINPIKGYGEKKPTEVNRDVGAKGGADAVGAKGVTGKDGSEVEIDHGNKAAVGDGTKPVNRDQGAVAGNKEVGDSHGSNKSAGKDGGVKRGEGVAEASGGGAAKGTKVETGETKEGAEPYADFRSKVRNLLGLEANKKIVNGPLNEPNKGLNKGK